MNRPYRRLGDEVQQVGARSAQADDRDAVIADAILNPGLFRLVPQKCWVF